MERRSCDDQMRTVLSGGMAGVRVKWQMGVNLAGGEGAGGGGGAGGRWVERAGRDSRGQGWRCALVLSAEGAFGGLPTSVGSRGVTVLQVPSCRTNCRRRGGSCQTVGRLVQGPELGRACGRGEELVVLGTLWRGRQLASEGGKSSVRGQALR